MKRISRIISSLLVVPTFVGCAETGGPAPDTGIGLQLYSVRGLMSSYEQGSLTLFKDLAGMGFDYVEAYGYGDGKFFGHTPAQFKLDMEAAGLTVPASHFSIALTPEQLESGDFSEALAQWDKPIADHIEAGIPNILMAWIQNPPKTTDGWKVYAKYFNAIGKKCKAAGLGFGYHNHSFEFKAGEDGVFPYDCLLQNTDPKLVFFELDTYWMGSMGQNIADWVARYPGRFKMMHIKDDDVIGASGKVDFEALLALKEQAGTQYGVLEIEQYGSELILGAISKSIVNWSAILDKVNGNAPAGETVCTLEIYDIETKTRTAVATFPRTVEAPNWTPDGKWLIYNSGGLLYRIAADGSTEPEKIETGSVARCNNDHCLTFDGKQIGISSGSKDDWRSRIYVCPIEGGEPVEITPVGPSYLHGWSPDSKTLVYCADRDGEFDVYSIPAEGGKETRLTTAPGLDDGPEYTPDGKYIWFNSVRSGLMQLWRMKADGSDQEQMTFDEDRNTWFGHVSPDGQKVVGISYWKGDLEPGQHLGDRYVELRLMPADGGTPETVVALYGGQGTINVNSWAPDSKRFAFVSFVKKQK